MILWRLSLRQHIQSLDGEGSKQYGGRWNTPGTAMVYTSESLALSTLETLVHLELSELPENYVYACIETPADMHPQVLPEKDLPEALREHPEWSMQWGDQWVRSGNALLVRVPTVVIPVGYNYLINPAHPDMSRVRVVDAQPFFFDPRLGISS